MSHGRKRMFLAGAFLGIVLLAGVLAGAAVGFGIRPGPPGYPYFSEGSARRATLEWARLQPFPEEVDAFVITTGGSMFTRDFRVSFFGDPAVVERWVAGCPGVTDPATKREVAADGTITYEIQPGGGAAFAELVHHPARGTVRIRVYWS